MPNRGSLVLDCVRVMRLRIASGEWRDLLPGERRLAEMLQVGRDTVRLALQHMERDGLLAATNAGNRRHILVEPSGQDEKQSEPLKIGFLSHRPLERLSQPMLLEVDRLRAALAAKGGSLHIHAPTWYEQRNPSKRLETLIAEESCTAWLLLRSSSAVQQWFMKRKIPCLIRGYPHPGIDLPHLDVDWRATARHAAGQLWRLGHRRVLVLRPTEELKGVDAAVDGVRDLGEPDFESVIVTEDGTSPGIGRTLARALQYADPPTAIIATRARQAASALTWLASQGIRVPYHISLLALSWEPYLDYLVPEITCYHTDAEAVARLVVRRLERIADGDSHPGGNAWITPEAIKGASIGRL